MCRWRDVIAGSSAPISPNRNLFGQNQHEIASSDKRIVMVWRPKMLSQSLPSFRYRLFVVYQKSLNVSEQNCNVYWWKVSFQLTPKLKSTIYGTTVPLTQYHTVVTWKACEEVGGAFQLSAELSLSLCVIRTVRFTMFPQQLVNRSLSTSVWNRMRSRAPVWNQQRKGDNSWRSTDKGHNNWYLNHLRLNTVYINSTRGTSFVCTLCLLPQWGAADAEIKVPSGENTELKRSPFKTWSGSVYGHTCHAYCQEFLPRLFLRFRSIHLHFFLISPDFSCIGCG